MARLLFCPRYQERKRVHAMDMGRTRLSMYEFSRTISCVDIGYIIQYQHHVCDFALKQNAVEKMSTRE